MKKLIRNRIFIAATFFLLGVISMYFYNWKLITDNKILTKDLVINFRDNYQIQENLKRNYSDAYIVQNEFLKGCIIKIGECNANEIPSELDKLSTEREDLEVKLDDSNDRIEAILSKTTQSKD